MRNNYIPIILINVFLKFGKNSLSVGRLAAKNDRIYFEYDSSFIKQGLEISPFKLPLKTALQSFDLRIFEGLAGVFNDSLPDGWGRLLLDRSLRAKGIDPSSFSVLDRLAHVGEKAMGALVYIPDYSEDALDESIDLERLSLEVHEVLKGDRDDFFEELLVLNGSSAGARPKALIGVDEDKTNLVYGVEDLQDGYEHWLVKFANLSDGMDAGAIEYVYSEMARQAGVEVTETYLFPAKKCAGYFAAKRFDRTKKQRLHLHTACGLLHSDFRVPSLDYEDLIKAVFILTKDVRQAQKMYRLAVFNVLSHNRDDHAKNFSFLMDDKGQWKMAPAYDLTFSRGPGGEQSTMVMGEGRQPTKQHLLALAKIADVSDSQSKDIISQTEEALNKWPLLAKKAGVSKAKIDEIARVILCSK